MIKFSNLQDNCVNRVLYKLVFNIIILLTNDWI